MKKPYNNRNTTTIYIKCIQEISSALRFPSNLTLQTSLLALIQRRKVILLLHCSLQTEHLIKLCLEKIFSEQQIRGWWASWDTVRPEHAGADHWSLVSCVKLSWSGGEQNIGFFTFSSIVRCIPSVTDEILPTSKYSATLTKVELKSHCGVNCALASTESFLMLKKN